MSWIGLRLEGGRTSIVRQKPPWETSRDVAPFVARPIQSDSYRWALVWDPAESSSMERTIMHRCGHEHRHHVGGYFVVDQDREEARLMRRDCPACLRRSMSAPADRLRPSPGDRSLPLLAGSVRQVAWAEAIRRDRLAALGRIDPAAAASAAEVTDACWWIDHRTADPRTLATAGTGDLRGL